MQSAKLTADHRRGAPPNCLRGAAVYLLKKIVVRLHHGVRLPSEERKTAPDVRHELTVHIAEVQPYRFAPYTLVVERQVSQQGLFHGGRKPARVEPTGGLHSVQCVFNVVFVHRHDGCHVENLGGWHGEGINFWGVVGITLSTAVSPGSVSVTE